MLYYYFTCHKVSLLGYQYMNSNMIRGIHCFSMVKSDTFILINLLSTVDWVLIVLCCTEYVVLHTPYRGLEAET